MGKAGVKAGVALCAVLLQASAQALSPSEVFQKASPSVWAVRALDAEERPIRYGSAVVIAPGRLVTNCHVLAKARSIQLRRENAIFEAALEHADLQRDLCTLSAKDFTAPPAAIARFGELVVGQRVFAVGNPERMAATLSDGLLSGLKNEDGAPSLQTTAPLSPGFSGGGLFDESGRLVGITTLGPRARPATAPSLHLAVPAEWAGEVAERAKAQMAGVRQAAAPAAGEGPVPGLPAVGTTWKYGFRDRQYSGPERIFTIRIAEARAGHVRESFATGNEEERALNVDPDAIQFTARRLTSDYSAIELAPYFFSSAKAEPGIPVRPARYPTGGQFDVGIARLQPEDITVPAGTYKAMRLDVTGTIAGGGSQYHYNAATVVRFHYTAWYAPAVHRYVMVRNRTFNARGAPMGDEVTQLLEHRLN